MPITSAQKELRRKFLGSSDAAAVLGMDHFRTPLDIFLDKTGQIQPTGIEPENDAMDIGNFLEAGVLNWFGSKKKLPLILNDETDRNRRLHANGIMAANFDAFVDGDPTQAVEAKTHGVVSEFISEDWGEVETDQVPERVALQCYHQMAVVPTVQTIWVPVLLGGVGLRHYRIDRNQELIANLEQAEVKFWREHVETGIPPEGLPSSMDTFKKLRRVPQKSVVLPDELVGNWLQAKEALKRAEDEKEQKELLVFAALGDAEEGTSAYGKLTYFLNKGRASYTVEAKPPFRQQYFKKAKA
jgi:predicted phage-related endonuclease